MAIEQEEEEEAEKQKINNIRSVRASERAQTHTHSKMKGNNIKY